jgi:RNA recognition motif
MIRTLYTGRLWFEATEDELKDWFGQYGPVEAATISEDPEMDLPDEKGVQRVGHRGELIDLLEGRRDQDEARFPGAGTCCGIDRRSLGRRDPWSPIR